MYLFRPLLGKQINLIYLNASIGLLTNKVDLVEAVIVLALDLGRPWRVALGVDED